MRNDATDKPWHDEWGTVITGPTLPILVIARLDRAISVRGVKRCHGQAVA